MRRIALHRFACRSRHALQHRGFCPCRRSFASWISLEGFAHPFTGLDHLLAMVAVGLWASQLGGRALWLLPLTFPVVMAAGAALGFGGVALPWVEIGITVSVLVLGAAVALTYRPALAVSLPLIGLFALLHGYAHGVELPAQTSALTYCAGFVAATLGLHLAGLAHRLCGATRTGSLCGAHRRRRDRGGRRDPACDGLTGSQTGVAIASTRLGAGWGGRSFCPILAVRWWKPASAGELLADMITAAGSCSTSRS